MEAMHPDVDHILFTEEETSGVWGNSQVALFWLVPETYDGWGRATRGTNSGFSCP